MSLNFKIASQLDSAGFTQAAEYMRKLGDQTKNTRKETEEHKGVVDNLSVSYEALVAIGVEEFFRRSWEEAAQAREMEIQLAQRVNLTGLQYEKVKPKLQAFFENLRDQSGILEDRLIPAFNFLVDKTQNVRASQELMATVMGLARSRSMELSQAADLVAGAYAGIPRSVAQAGRILALTSDQMKDNNLVIAKLKENFGNLSTQMDKTTLTMDRFKNKWSEVFGAAGQDSSGFLAWLAKVGTGLLELVKDVARTMNVGVSLVLGFLKIASDAMVTTVKSGYARAASEAKVELKKLTDNTMAAFGRIAKSWYDSWQDPKKGTDNFVDHTKNKFEDLTTSMQVEIARGNLALAIGMRERLADTIKLLDLEEKAEIEKIRSTEEFQRLSAENQAKLLLGIHNKFLAEKRKAEENANKWWVDMTIQTGTEVGKAMGLALSGQHDSWKDLLKSIIHMVAQAAQAYISAWSTAEVYKDLASENYTGAAKAAIIGAVGVGAVAAGEAAADAAIDGNGGGSSSSPAGGGSYSTGGGMQATAAPAGDRRQKIEIIVQGDVVDGPAFLQALATRLSASVENNDVRLVASGLKS